MGFSFCYVSLKWSDKLKFNLHQTNLLNLYHTENENADIKNIWFCNKLSSTSGSHLSRFVSKGNTKYTKYILFGVVVFTKH